MRRLGEVIPLSAGYLQQHSSPTPRLDAELLIGHALGLSRVDLYVQHERPLDEPELAAIRTLLERRRAREPVAYILGSWGFRELTLEVDRRVLVPRPETEQLVDLCLELAGEVGGLGVLDVGTGSGAIALALKHARPEWQVAGSDLSVDALEVAAANGRRLGLEVEWLAGDLLGAAEGRRFGLIVSNPPYVAEADIEGLEPEVRDWEPRAALVAGAAGLDVLERLIARAPASLEAGGRLALECGAGQAGGLGAAMREQGWGDVQVRTDFAGVERMLAGVRP